MPPSTYGAYEDQKRYKKRFIPVELAHSLVSIFTQHGIDRADVLALAGIGIEGERAAPPPMPALQLVTMQVALPNEAALARMFEGLLRPLDHRSLSPAELARTLAQRLPIGLGQLQDLMPALAQSGARDGDIDPQADATDGPALQPTPRT